MENQHFCQSCSMPLDATSAGTELDGTASTEYCKYCYQNGAFTQPDATLEGMTLVVKSEMEKRSMPSDLITRAANTLPHLKRWKARTETM